MSRDPGTGLPLEPPDPVFLCEMCEVAISEDQYLDLKLCDSCLEKARKEEFTEDEA